MTMPQACQADIRPSASAGATASASRTASVDMASCPGLSGRPEEGGRRAICSLAGDLLDAGDHLVHGLVDGNLLVEHPVRRLRPHILVIENRELVVLDELEGHRAGLVLVVDRLAMPVLLPELALLRGFRDREPAPERALDVRRQVLLL